MLNRAEYRKGRCPGAHAPMRAQDGLIVRLRVRGARLAVPAARALAAAARRFGDGACELTSRANLQLRGVRDDALPPLLEALASEGLIDDHAAAEAVRNVLTGPLAGLAGAPAAAPLAAAIEAMLSECDDLRRLPAKFGFLVDGGGPLSVAGEAGDVRFLYDEGRGLFSIAIGGEAAPVSIGAAPPQEAAAAGLRLARAFLHVRETWRESRPGDPPDRMSEIVAVGEAGRLAAMAGFAPGETRPIPPAPPPPPPVGLLAFGDPPCLGGAAPFGLFSAAMIETAAQTAEVDGIGEIRLTPWRAIFAPRVSGRAAPRHLKTWGEAGLIVRGDDPRLAVAACVGAPSCARGGASTRADALALAGLARRLVPAGLALHVSGCAKGCARPRPAPLTLVAHDGVYDLVRDGAPFDPPIARNMALTAARDLLHAMAQDFEATHGHG